MLPLAKGIAEAVAQALAEAKHFFAQHANMKQAFCLWKLLFIFVAYHEIQPNLSKEMSSSFISTNFTYS